MSSKLWIDNIAISGTEYPYKNINEVLEMAKILNVKNLELWIPHNFKFEEIDRLTRILDQDNLKVICVSTWTQLNSPEDIEEKLALINLSIEAAKIFHSSIVNTYFGPNPNRNIKDSIDNYIKNIEKCLNKAINENITIVLENEFEKSGTDITRKADNVLEIINKINSPYFQLNFDPCNFYFAGEEPFPYAYNVLKDHIKYIHLKDGMKFSNKLYKNPGDGFLWQDASGDYICTTLGKGAIPWEAFLKQLKKDGYKGIFTLEPHVPLKFLEKTFKDSLNYLIGLTEKANFQIDRSWV